MAGTDNSYDKKIQIENNSARRKSADAFTMTEDIRNNPLKYSEANDLEENTSVSSEKKIEYSRDLQADSLNDGKKESGENGASLENNDLADDDLDEYEDDLTEDDPDEYEDDLTDDDLDEYEDDLAEDDLDEYEDDLTEDDLDEYEDDLADDDLDKYEDDLADEDSNEYNDGLKEAPDSPLKNRELQRRQFLKEDAAMKKKTGLVSVSLFAAVMLFFGVVGMLLPLRPTESVIEKRELKKFPEADLISVLEGDYFNAISDWYSDSYPMRDTWMKMSDWMERAYGIRTVRVIVGDNTKDEIPEATRPQQNISEEQETDFKDASEPAQTEPMIQVTSEETQSEPEETQPMQTEEEQETIAKISAERQNGLLVNGDSAFGIYYFNREAADTYIAAVNRTAERLEGQADVYCMIVPLSSSFYLSEETLRGTDGSDEVAAIDYYYNSLDTRIIPVEIYDTLQAHQSDYIYFRTDHHWNGPGAYYAYREFASAKGITPHELSEYELKEFPNFTGSYYVSSKAAAMESNPDTILAYVPITYNTMTFTDVNGNELSWPIVHDVSGYANTQKYSCFAGSDNPFSVIENPNVTNGEVCLVIKESYGNALIPFLTDHYQTIYWIDYRDYDGNIIDFAKTHGVNDVIFVNGTDPLSSVEKINRLSELLP